MGTIIHAVHLGRQTLDPMQIHNEHIDPDTLAAYALDALPSDELIAIGTHLAACPDCQREVASFRAVGEYLPHGLALAEPPSGLRERVIARAQATPQNAAAAAASRTVRTKAPSPLMRLPWLRRLTPFAVAFALVAGVLFGRYWPTETPSLVEEPGVQSVALTGDGQGTGTFAVAANSNRAQLQVTGLPPLPAGQVYQLWLLDGDTPISVGTFSVDAQGRGRLEFNGLAWSSGYQTVAITTEEQGGSPVPTSNIVIAGGL
jgi:anti-sigma-K factor RskA